MGLKVAVIGGGSTYTPELIDGLANRRERLPIDELALHDINAERREVVGGLAQRMLTRLGWEGRLTLTDDARAAVDGADFVLIQLRIGGQAARLLDETLPLRFGTIGQETTGAGGLAKALRTVPVVLELAELARRHAAPGAWIVDFTNPVGIVTQALIDAGHRALGLCNVAITLQRSMAAQLGVDPDRAGARARRAQPPQLDHGGARGRGRSAPGADRAPRRRHRQGAEPAGGQRSAISARFRPTTCATTTPSMTSWPSRTADTIVPRRSWTSNASCSRCTPIRPSTESPSCWHIAAAPSTARPPHSCSRPSTTGPGTSRSSTSATTARWRSSRTTTSSRSRRASTATAPIRFASRRCSPRCAISSERSRPTSGWRSEPPHSGERADVRAALEAHPLVGGRIGDVDPLLDALLEANRPYLPQFSAVT